ncbi:predicted protein [Naegleria gruberi]|uniref:Predicted protein n=1 Tax=Naegleria gruberi TaxID=5762 RepID=D2VWH5_NAEGR|nr:uncharacterized protein NAEGRDRAFT_73382 [Naegleria gruberi]EFC38840.1 predicted protein [Naegleria gruberi]|eukprot:XP_002671584.1 predicted protein [Naegleria gruberi strain NEG-M]
MQKSKLLISLFCLMVLFALFVQADGSSGVVLELNTQNFETTIQSNPQKVFFIKFFAPWCGHCKRLAGTWSELAKELEDSSVPHFQNVQLAKVNCDEHPDIRRKYSIRGYPTLVLFVGGKPVTEYYGYRTVPKFKSFLDDVFSSAKSSGSVDQVTEVELESKIKNQNRAWTVMFYNSESAQTKQFDSNFQQLATNNKDTNNFFAKIDCNQEKELCTKRLTIDLTNGPQFVIFTGSDKMMSQFKEQPSVESLQKFITSGHVSSKVQIPGPVDNTPTILHFLNDHPYISIGVVTMFCIAICGIFLAILCMSDDSEKKGKTEPAENTENTQTNPANNFDVSSDEEGDKVVEATSNETAPSNLKKRNLSSNNE